MSIARYYHSTRKSETRARKKDRQNNIYGVHDYWCIFGMTVVFMNDETARCAAHPKIYAIGWGFITVTQVQYLNNMSPTVRGALSNVGGKCKHELQGTCF